MRRTILFAFFLLAACGGGVRNTDTSAVDRSAQMRAQAFLLTADAQGVIAAFAQSASQDALDSCLNAWVEEAASGQGSLHEPVAKPDVAGFRAFLSACLGSSVPGDVRAAPVFDARTTGPGHLRAAPPAALRSTDVQ
ncbi:MAG TPA: hypothetical protein VLT82_20460 [Myxococcaceae bacterium]|nr:hypothetical protein [Myxococcaceae bacterium]